MGTTTEIIALKLLAGNTPIALNSFQKFLLPHTDLLIAIWFSAWCLTAIVLVMLLIRAWMKH